MIKETTPPSTSEEDFVRLEEDMSRDVQQEDEPHEPLDDEEEDEPPLLSSVFAVDQIKKGALTAASLFTWGLETVKEKASTLAESEQVQKFLDTTKPQREAISSGATTFWESTRPQREELARTASTLTDKVQPHVDKLKHESAKVL